MKETEQERAAELLVIGGSAGSLGVLVSLLEKLTFSAKQAALVVIHRNERFTSNLEDYIRERSSLSVLSVEEKMPVLPGVVYFAPPGYHVLIEKDKSFSLDVSERVNYCRPSIDVAMNQAALIFGHNTTALLLSGANEDGAKGMATVFYSGGTTLAQDPQEAEVSVMPLSALKAGVVKRVLTNVELRNFSGL